MEAKSGVPAEAVNQTANRVLFVEGRDSEAIDPIALKRLLAGVDVAVRALGLLLAVLKRMKLAGKKHFLTPQKPAALTCSTCRNSSKLGPMVKIDSVTSGLILTMGV